VTPDAPSELSFPATVFTIGVHGFTEEQFFGLLAGKGVEVLCDIRQRRGMRGPLYAFANSRRLQLRLAELGIRYVHAKEAAPTAVIREAQHRDDLANAVAKRDRVGLGEAFRTAYESEVLSKLDLPQILRAIGPCGSLCLLCVERLPEACHRSLVADRMAKLASCRVEHLLP
jgi:uncharacterized protein (DUF488 family)